MKEENVMKLIYKLYERYGANLLIFLYIKCFVRSVEKKRKWLELCGAKIGSGTVIKTGMDSFPEPYMVSIGDNVYIASNVAFMTHDGSLSWMSRKMGFTEKRTDKIGKIEIGNNCFVGSRAIIMHDVKIGNNCIIGMGAIVTHDVKDGTVVAGVPAKEICSTEDFIQKNSYRKDYTCGWRIKDKRRYYEEKYKVQNN